MPIRFSTSFSVKSKHSYSEIIRNLKDVACF